MNRGSHRRTRPSRQLATAARLSIEPLEPRQLLSKTIYVDVNSPGPTRDGTAWTTAYTDLQSALGSAVSGDQIHVADGTYKPTTTTDRTVTFQINSGVSVYGSYAGYGAANPDLRDTIGHATVLSGDVGVSADASDNSYNVVTCGNVTSPITLDGFTITSGHANGPTSYEGEGGGLCCMSGSLGTISNCIFTGNDGYKGGGAYAGGYTLTITGCTFLTNIAGNGGGIFSDGTPTITNCTFKGNAAYTGGGMFNSRYTSPTLVNCVFVGNIVSADPTLDSSSYGVYGAAVYDDATSASQYASPKFINCTISGNNGIGSIARGGSIYNATYVSATTTNCIIWGNSAPFEPPSGTNPLFFRNPSSGPDGIWGSADDDFGDLRISASSPMVDSGTNSAIPAGITTDIAGNARFQNVPTSTHSGVGTIPLVDAGAYEATPALVANAGGPYAVLQGASVILAGSGASNVTGALQYSWDLNGDGIFGDATGAAPTVNTNALIAGTVLAVTLRVTDGASHITTSTTTLTVAPSVAYVDSRATAGTNNGVNWTNAFTDLASALKQSISGQTIRVATGSYRPTPGSYRGISFQLKNGVALYGGYGGLGTANPDLRNATDYPSILSGDIGVVGNNADNSYHVVSAIGLDATAILDGFTISGGYAKNATDKYIEGGGAAVYDVGSSISINSCAFVGNGAASGGAIAIVTASPSITNCTFTSNSAGSGGAIGNFYTAKPTITNCAFQSNSATGSGGAIYNYYSCSPSISNSSFAGNTAASNGGAIFSDSFCGLSVTNSSFSGNRATFGGGAVENSNSSPLAFSNCSFTANTAGTGGAMYNSSCAPSLTNCSFMGNTASNGGAVAEESNGSPSFINCLLVGNSASYGGAVYAHSSGIGFYGCTVVGNIASINGGALSNSISASTAYGFHNTIAWANSAPTGSEIYSPAGSPNFDYTDIQGGGYSGPGMLNSDPQVYRIPSSGLDGAWGTADDDYGDLRLKLTSPCVDAGTAGWISPTSDIGGRPRHVDIPTAPDTGYGTAPLIDIGAYERQALASISGTSGDDHFYAMLNSDHATLAIWASTVPTGSPVFTGFADAITFNTQGGNDSLEVDFSNGTMPDVTHLDTGKAALQLTGFSSPFAITRQSTSVSVGSTTIGLSTNEMVTVDAALGSVVSVGTMTLSAPFNLPAGRQVVVASSGLSVNAFGSLDLADSKLIVHNASSTAAQSTLGTLIALLKSGLNLGSAKWTGSGIVSSIAAGDAFGVRGIGAIVNSTSGGGKIYGSGAAKGLFGGQDAATTDVLLKETYFGDADLSGSVDAADYSSLDNGYAMHLSGWINGDFNYDGVVNAADYSMIDSAFAFQSADGAPLAAVAAESHATPGQKADSNKIVTLAAATPPTLNAAVAIAESTTSTAGLFGGAMDDDIL